MVKTQSEKSDESKETPNNTKETNEEESDMTLEESPDSGETVEAPKSDETVEDQTQTDRTTIAEIESSTASFDDSNKNQEEITSVPDEPVNRAETKTNSSKPSTTPSAKLPPKCQSCSLIKCVCKSDSFYFTIGKFFKNLSFRGTSK